VVAHPPHQLTKADSTPVPALSFPTKRYGDGSYTTMMLPLPFLSLIHRVYAM
jgi:hypothetical protein